VSKWRGKAAASSATPAEIAEHRRDPYSLVEEMCGADWNAIHFSAVPLPRKGEQELRQREQNSR